MAQVRYFAGARDAAGTPSEAVDAPTLGALLTDVTTRRPRLTEVLPRCSVLVGGVRTTDPAAPLGADVTVDVLPPFAGG
ncbi:molybdopterin converting factor small subunit [Sediminihabitans luteus]|uniref:Molybdopterin converting factor small subunit n=1 Tax=Sediminihabitans luteus TaxID=1138585 RepID=A0A2M9CF28_9CELL|nr:MoaD/ThiS family protein [Sediminihabitans luteus]PJJ70462.1 molybdopterin converting factor small subunit [Sediminihabitans luteus]GII97935.1 molybdopterin synthase sulfur carrier subunit [Sediminihabitans luteus]